PALAGGTAVINVWPREACVPRLDRQPYRPRRLTQAPETLAPAIAARDRGWPGPGRRCPLACVSRQPGPQDEPSGPGRARRRPRLPRVSRPCEHTCGVALRAAVRRRAFRPRCGPVPGWARRAGPTMHVVRTRRSREGRPRVGLRPGIRRPKTPVALLRGR